MEHLSLKTFLSWILLHKNYDWNNNLKKKAQHLRVVALDVQNKYKPHEAIKI